MLWAFVQNLAVVVHAVAVSVLLGEISMHCTGAKCQLENKSDYKLTVAEVFLCEQIFHRGTSD